MYESNEEELTDFLQARNIAATHWAAEAFDVLENQSYGKESTLWCAEGSLTFRSGDTAMSLQPGDAVRLPADTTFTLEAGMSGYLCYRS